MYHIVLSLCQDIPGDETSPAVASGCTVDELRHSKLLEHRKMYHIVFKTVCHGTQCAARCSVP